MIEKTCLGLPPYFQLPISNTAMEKNLAHANSTAQNITDSSSDREIAANDLDNVSGGGEKSYNAGKAVGDAIENTFDWCVITAAKIVAGRVL